jgi:hypothetical protein
VNNSLDLMNQNSEVTHFLNTLNHPLRKEIELLRSIILETEDGIEENIKWNGPNYAFEGADRITMKIQPPKKIQLIFHRGAKKKEQPVGQLITDPFSLLEWRENDRAIASYKNSDEISSDRTKLTSLIDAWVKAK